MARLATSVTLFLSLLFLFTFSHARDIQDPLPGSELAKETHPGPETTRSNSKQQHDTVSFTLDKADPVPLTFVSFRPINRHVAQRPLPLPLSLRLGRVHRRCFHGHRREIPYGNDMIVRSDDAVDPPNRGVARQIPTRWVRIRHGEPRFTDMIPHHHHHVMHSKHHEAEHEEGWFSKKIREFLNMFRF